MTQTELIKKEIERLKAEQVQYSDIYESVDDYARASMCEGMVSTLSHLLSFIESLEKEQPQEIVKEARISPGALTNFGTSSFVLDVELTQEEQAKLCLSPGFGSGTIKIKILCE